MSKPPVLLVHGFASSFERNWREPGWVDLLQDEGREVLGIDLPGHGEAEKPHDPQAYANLDQFVIDRLPSDPVDAIGFSLGGQLLLAVASTRPRAFRRIVVGGVGDNIFATEGDPEPVAQAIEAGQAGETGPAVAGAFARFGQAEGNDTAALAAFLRRPRSPVTKEQLAAIDVPVLVVLGTKDFVGSADTLLEVLPDARLVSLSGADHFGTPKDFRFVEAALDFIRD